MIRATAHYAGEHVEVWFSADWIDDPQSLAADIENVEIDRVTILGVEVFHAMLPTCLALAIRALADEVEWERAPK